MDRLRSPRVRAEGSDHSAVWTCKCHRGRIFASIGPDDFYRASEPLSCFLATGIAQGLDRSFIHGLDIIDWGLAAKRIACVLPDQYYYGGFKRAAAGSLVVRK